MEFTGERLVPGKVDGDLWAEHFSRYVFAEPLVRGRRVLDLGCGAGYGAAHLSRAARALTALDLAPDAVAYAKETFPGKAVAYIVGNASKLPFASASFEVVVCFEVIEHLRDQQALLAEVRRVLTPGGIFVVSTPNRLYYTDERHEENHFHVRELDLAEFRALLQTEFRQVRLYLQNHAPAVVIDTPGDALAETARLATAEREPSEQALRTAHYAIAVCGSELPDAQGVVFFPQAQGNVLREREKHIQLLQSELQRSQADFLRAEKERLSQQAWALDLDQALAKAQLDCQQTDAELQERTRWARDLDAEVQRNKQAAQSLQVEFEERTRWAKSAAAEAEALRRSVGEQRDEADRLRGKLAESEATAARARREATAFQEQFVSWQESTEKRVEELSARNLELERHLRQQIAALQADLEQLRSRSLLRQLAPGWATDSTRLLLMGSRLAAETLARLVLPQVAAVASVPLAAGLFGAGMALSTAGRLLPRRPPMPNVSPRDPTLATLLILNYNGKALLAKNLPYCQAAIARSGRTHELLVVDNGSSDGSLQLLREKFPDVQVVPLRKNHFFSAGNNAGVPHAKHDIIVLLNNDMRVEPGFLEPLLAPFATDPDVFAVSSEILMDHGKRRVETGFTKARFEHGMLAFRHDPVPSELTKPAPIFWAGGGSAAFDKRKFLEIGGLDVLFDPFYCEDADLSLRAWMRGWKVLFTPESKVWHDHRTTTRKVFGEAYVDETVRRNMLLLHWANTRDARSLLEHTLALPSLVERQVKEHGVSGLRSVARAVQRAPRALSRRLFERGDGPSFHEIAERTSLGVLPFEPRRAKKLRSPNDPLKVVMVAPYHLWPIQHGGAVRMYHVLKGLAARGHDVSLVGYVDTDEQLEGARHLREFCSDVRLLKRKPIAAPPAWDLVPPMVREFDQADLRGELARLIERRDPDVLQVEYTHLAPFALPSGRHITALTEHDVAFLSLRRQAEAERDPARRRELRIRSLKMFRYELQALERFDLIVTVSKLEADLLRSYTRGRVRITDRAPLGVDIETWSKLARKPDAATLLFVGNFAHAPNVDAALWLGREIMPAIHAKNPSVRLDIVGPKPPLEVQALARDPRIRVTGYLDDPRSLYETASVFVSPVRVGAGVRVKLLETFAASVPVVSTTLGAEGLEVVHGQHLLLADTAESFATEVDRLLRAPETGVRLAQAAQRHVADRFAWPNIIAALEEEYRSALRAKGLERSVP